LVKSFRLIFSFFSSQSLSTAPLQTQSKGESKGKSKQESKGENEGKLKERINKKMNQKKVSYPVMLRPPCFTPWR
jgi:hypothetical protein